MIITKDFLDGIASEEIDHFLIRIAKDQMRFAPLIAQINRMWEGLSADAKRSNQLISRILSYESQSDFRGALHELIGYWFLSQYFNEITYDPNIGGQTPDFLVVKGDDKIHFECFSIGKDRMERREQENLDVLAKEVEDIESKWQLTILGTPTPNNEGKFTGIRAVLNEYLCNLPEGTDTQRKHEVSVDGAVVRFMVYPFDKTKKLSCNFISDVKAEDNQVEMIKSRIRERIEKYNFPFVALCVVDSLHAVDTFTMMEAMIGKELFGINLEKRESRLVGYSDDGVWGRKNPALKDYLRLRGIVFIRQRALESEEIELRIHMMENQHYSRIGLKEMFNNEVPDLFDPNYCGDRSKMPSLKMTP